MAEESRKVNRDPYLFERRRFVRVDGNFVVSYSDVTTAEIKSDVTQTKNISVGGILFTTDRKFEKDTILKIKMRIPDSSGYFHARVKVIDSKQRVKDLLYDIRAKFVGIRDEDRESIRRIVEYNVHRKQ